MDRCGFNVLCERISHIYVYTRTHMNDDLLNKGELDRCYQEYPKQDDALHMQCPNESVSHMI